MRKERPLLIAAAEVAARATLDAMFVQAVTFGVRGLGLPVGRAGFRLPGGRRGGTDHDRQMVHACEEIECEEIECHKSMVAKWAVKIGNRTRRLTAEGLLGEMAHANQPATLS